MPEAPKIAASEVSDQSLAEKNKNKLQFIEEVTLNADDVQRRVLEEILTRNADVEYLKRHGLQGRADRETFKRVIPVVTYEDIQPEINRIANGDKSQILCSHPISEFLTRFDHLFYLSSFFSSSLRSLRSISLFFWLCFNIQAKILKSVSLFFGSVFIIKAKILRFESLKGQFWVLMGTQKGFNFLIRSLLKPLSKK